MRSSRLLFSLAALATIVARAVPQPPAAPQKGELTGNAAKAAEFAAAESARYEIRHADPSMAALRLVPEPVLRWSNPLVADVHGSVYLWTNNGCPEVAASIFQFFDRRQLNVELVSLAMAPLRADRNGRPRWTPDAGVRFAPLAGGPAPADTAERRHLQMRQLARTFTGYLTEQDEADNRPTELRLMASPLYRYEATDKSGREGAVFSLVTANDPDILLMIESRPGNGGREWVWAGARMHHRPLQLKRADTVVWQLPAVAPPWTKIRGPEGTYIILQWPTPEAAAKD